MKVVIKLIINNLIHHYLELFLFTCSRLQKQLIYGLTLPIDMVGALSKHSIVHVTSDYIKTSLRGRGLTTIAPLT